MLELTVVNSRQETRDNVGERELGSGIYRYLSRPGSGCQDPDQFDRVAVSTDSLGFTQTGTLPPDISYSLPSIPHVVASYALSGYAARRRIQPLHNSCFLATPGELRDRVAEMGSSDGLIWAGTSCDLSSSQRPRSSRRE